ncbi:hypothetical protein GCM10022234_00030 [Aeromicrobium panaciterrae]|uniref:SGNH/GDSL hydrolase family protein n=1 Tax=Aeromicrobium panaciterrae TaxID=363861 RepID=UPI0031E0ACCA
MPLPGDVPKVTLTYGSHIDSAATPIVSGVMLITPEMTRTHIASGTYVDRSPIEVPIANGVGTSNPVIASDAPGFNVDGLVLYTISFLKLIDESGKVVKRHPIKNVSLPLATPTVDVDLLDASTQPGAKFTYPSVTSIDELTGPITASQLLEVLGLEDVVIDVSGLTSSLASEITDRLTGDQDNADAIATETAARTGAVAAINDALTDKADLVGGQVPGAQLPSYVDDVLPYANLAAFPNPGEAGKIYIAEDSNKQYRWAGVGPGYQVISDTIALGENASTAYRGDRGKTAYEHSQSTGNPHGTAADVVPFNPSGSIGANTVAGALAELDSEKASVVVVAGKVDATPAGKERLAIVDNSKLWPFRAALGKRDTRLVNVGILGASSTEGAFVGSFDRTLSQQLVKLLRNRYPTAGLAAGAGGRGFIGIPSRELTTSPQYAAGMWPQAFTGGAYDPPSSGAASAFDAGAKHMSWYSNVVGSKYVHSLATPVTSYEVHHAKGTSGTATSGYHKPDAGSSTVFSTGPTVGLAKETGGAATSTIEVGVNAAGYLVATGIREYAGDETKGIQVHNFGHSGMKIADWQDGYAIANSWREHLASFNLDLLILHDLGANDAFGGMTPAQVKTAIVNFIVILRAGGITCPIVVSALFDPSGGAALGSPWSSYATVMREIADADATVLFVDHSVRMPSTAVTDTLGLYSTVDHVHARADGAINKWQASTYDAFLAAA